MRANISVTSDNFLVFTKPADFANPKARSIAAAHAAKFGSKKSNEAVGVWYDKPCQSVVRWRLGSDSHRLVRVKSKSKKKGARHQQDQTAGWCITKDIPISPNARLSLQQFFQANPFFFYPAQVMLDAGSEITAAYFPTIDINDVYNAVVGMLLSWLVTQFPTQYSESAAIFHNTKAISILRKRLSQGIYDEVTYLSILWAMQTAALLGDKDALLAHDRGLDELGGAMKNPLSDYCRTIRPRHKTLMKEALGSPSASTKYHLKHDEQQQPTTSPLPDETKKLILSLPEGFRKMMCERGLFDLDTIKYWAKHFARFERVRSNETSDPSSQDFNFSVPIYDVMGETRRKLGTSDRIPTLKRFIYLADYVYLSSRYYRRIVHSSPYFQDFRAEATEFIYQYRPCGLNDRNIFIHSSLLIIHSWRNGVLLDEEGILLVANLKRRFPDVQDWSVLRDIIENDFFHFGLVLAEWEYNWSLTSADCDMTG